MRDDIRDVMAAALVMAGIMLVVAVILLAWAHQVFGYDDERHARLMIESSSWSGTYELFFAGLS